MADKYNPTQFKDLMGYLTRPSEDKRRMRDYFETNDPVEFGKEIIRRAVPIDFSEVPVLENVSIGMGVPNRLEIGANFPVGGGELMIGAGMQGQDKSMGIGFRKEFDDGGRVGFKNRGSVITEDMQKKSAEAIKSKTTKKLKDFVEKFKLENDGELPTQQQIMKAVGGKSSSIQKYLEEGVDFKKRITKQEAGRLAGLKSGEVRAVAEGQDPSYVKRAKTLQEANKFLSAQEKADFKKINDGKKFINNYFKNNPEAINTTEFGKNIKELLALRLDKDTGAIFSKVRSDDYYKNLAEQGKLFDIFDIKAVKEGGRNLRFPTNINIAPGQFNQVFIQSQVGKYFAKGPNPEALKNVEDILKKYKLRVKLPEVGYLGADNPVAVSRATGDFPKISDTLKSMKAPQEVLDQFKAREDLVQRISSFGCPNVKFALGGRVKFSQGSACFIKGKNKLDSIIKGAGKTSANDMALANGILKTGRGLKNAVALRGLFGPAAMALTVLSEGGILGYDMLSQGKSLKEAMGDSLFNLMLGDDYRFNNDFLARGGTFDERLDKLKFNPNQKQLINNFREYVNTMNRVGSAFEEQDKAQRLLDETGQKKGRLGKDRTPILEKNLFDATERAQAVKKEMDNLDYERALRLQSGMTEGQDLMGKAINLAELQQLGSVDQNIYGKGFEGPIAEEKRQKRILELLPTALNFAGGGIAKQAGDSSGKPPISGPTPQGLPGLLKRGI